MVGGAQTSFCIPLFDALQKAFLTNTMPRASAHKQAATLIAKRHRIKTPRARIAGAQHGREAGGIESNKRGERQLKHANGQGHIGRIAK